MTIARVQEKSGGVSGNANVAVTWPTATTTGNLLVAVVSAVNSTGGLHTVTVTPPSGWSTAVGPIQSAAGAAYIFYKANAASQSATGNFTSNQSSSKSSIAIIVAEYSGVATSTPLDETASGGGGGTGTTATTSTAKELWVGAVGIDQGNPTFSSPTNSFALVDQTSPDSSTAVCLLELIASSIGTAGSSVTESPGSTSNGAIATFEAAAGGAPPPIGSRGLNNSMWNACTRASGW